MIKNQWYAVLDSKQVKKNKLIGVTRVSEKLVFWRDEDNDVPDIPFFQELKEGFSYSGFSETWGVHYTRAIENQLDVVHLPFVHKSTIGRDGRKIVNSSSKIMNKIILHQDRHVVLTQLPIKSELKMGENLIPGDLPIIEFRKRREYLKNK